MPETAPAVEEPGTDLNHQDTGTSPPEQRAPAAQPRPEPVNVDAAVEKEIMSKLPRTRPQRRSARRPASAKAGKSAGGRSAGAQKAAAGKRASTPRGSARAGTARKAAKKSAPSVPEQALGAAITAARLPLRITAGLAKRANDLIGRIR